MKLVKRLLPHACIIFAGMMITFFIIDNFNEAMALINNATTKLLLFLFSIVSVIVSCMLISKQRREDQ